jgi:hypothetical protein
VGLGAGCRAKHLADVESVRCFLCVFVKALCRMQMRVVQNSANSKSKIFRLSNPARREPGGYGASDCKDEVSIITQLGCQKV